MFHIKIVRVSCAWLLSSPEAPEFLDGVGFEHALVNHGGQCQFDTEGISLQNLREG